MSIEQYDIVIIGAGLSGVGAAVHFRRSCPDKRITLFESREAIGGTWDLFRYPGVRSDSDMFTLGYAFKPWLQSQGIADGKLIRNYITEAAQENGIVENIQFFQRVIAADWRTDEQCWWLTVRSEKDGSQRHVKANFVMACTGYYNYQCGHTPEFMGRDSFKGNVVHPQQWPEGFDYAGKKVVIIGSGATAVTLAPAMSDKAQHVTVLQRSPSYVASMPKVEPGLAVLRKALSSTWYYRLVRARNISVSFLFYQYCRFFPNGARRVLQKGVRDEIGETADMQHFKPRYDPWDERVCVVADGDMFKAIRRGDVSMVTDRVARFNEQGIVLTSGEQLDADVIVTATGLDLQLLGGMALSVDGETYDVTQKLCYRGVLMQDLPNMGFVFGYTNASWTLKADLVMKYVCRIINRMSGTGARQVVPRNTDNDPGGVPFLDLQSGYVMRAKDKMPQQGSRSPWRFHQNYLLDFLSLRFGRLNDGRLMFSGAVAENENTDPATTAEQ